MKVHATPAGSCRPFASTAHTWKTCAPSLSPCTVFDELHELMLPPSNEHKNVLWLSDDENEKLAVFVLIVPLGPPVASVRGGGNCTVNLHITPTGSS
ncbi:MAG: hypothetical protein ACTHMY_13010 [Solirubrobacteraceae bacterium]